MNQAKIHRKAAELQEAGRSFVMVTVTRTEGSTPSVSGGKLILTSGGESLGTIGGGTLEKLALEEASEVLKTGENRLKNYILDRDRAAPEGRATGMMCGGEVTLFYEFYGSPLRAVIFGAGHIGRALSPVLSSLDFRVTVLDDRDETPDAAPVHPVTRFRDAGDGLTRAGELTGSFVVIATHSHELDYQLLKALVLSGNRTAYTGLVASRKKLGTMRSRFADETGSQLNPESFFSPAGLAIGGRSPGEIAVSIVSEIQGIRYGMEHLPHLSGPGRNPT